MNLLVFLNMVCNETQNLQLSHGLEGKVLDCGYELFKTVQCLDAPCIS